MMTLAMVLIVGQVAVVWIMLRFVRAFDSYTSALLQVHDGSRRIHERQETITAHLRSIGLRKGEESA